MAWELGLFLDGKGGTRGSLKQSTLSGFLEGKAGKRKQLQRGVPGPRHTMAGRGLKVEQRSLLNVR